MASHKLKPPPRRQPLKLHPRTRIAMPPPPAPAWPEFTGQATYVGTSPSGRVAVYVDPTLGPQGLQNATDLCNDADRIVAQNDSFFASSDGSVAVIVYAIGGATDGTGGADHATCDYVTGNAIEVCASFGASIRCSALFEAELSECNMGGNVCGESTGEGLSRWCAAAVSSNALADFATAPTWAADGMANFVDATDPTDQNADAIGCTMAFLSWLLATGYTLAQIAQGMIALGDSGTLCELYANLTGDDAANAWAKFQAAVNALPFGVVSDDPFGGLPAPSPTPGPPAPAPAPSPAPSPSPGGGAPTLVQAIAWAQQGVADGLTANWPAGQP